MAAVKSASVLYGRIRGKGDIGPAVEAAAVGAAALIERCSLCGALEPPATTCAAEEPHHLCGACWNAYAVAHQKNRAIPMCAEITCAAALHAAAPKTCSRSSVRMVQLEGDPGQRSDEHEKIVEQLGESGAKGAQEIFRVDNPPLRGIFEACRARLEKGGRANGANIKTLFYSTTRAAAVAIARSGFDTRLPGGGRGNEDGFLFSTSAAAARKHFASDCLLLCEVLVGDPGRDCKEMRDGFVVTREQQLYPGHVIHYGE